MRALAIVSCVVKVLLATMKSVSAGSSPWVFQAKSPGSTFDTKRNSRPGAAKSRSASLAIAGPRSLPPIPMFTTVRIGRPVWPVQRPHRTSSANAAMRSSTAWTSGTTSRPPVRMTVPRGARSATWSTARSSVTLMRSPANIAARRDANPDCPRSARRSFMAAASSRCLLKSR